jgi:thioredoxin 2
MPAVAACPSCGTRNRVPAAAAGTPRCGRCKQPLPWQVDADDQTFAEVAEQAALPVLVDMWAQWCPPCHTVSPFLDQLAVELAGRCKVVKVNVDVAPRTPARYGIRTIPTLLVLRDGRVVSRQVGAVPLDQLRAWLLPTLDPAPAQ